MHAPKDGSVIAVGVNMPILINLVQRPNEVPFDIDSFDYLASITQPEKGMIARADAPFSTIEEMIDHAKKNGLVISAAAGPETFIANALVKASDGTIRKLSAEGGAEELTHILGKHADVAFGGGEHLAYLQRGEIKMLASINSERLSYAQDKPTLIEEGFNLSIDPLFYVAAPAGLDPEAKAALVEALDRAVHSDAVKDVVVNTLTSQVENFGPEGTRQFLKDGLVSVGQIFK
jgi:tripartite-type tricarboxylate transporter receptor subunit TctC